MLKLIDVDTAIVGDLLVLAVTAGVEQLTALFIFAGVQHVVAERVETAIIDILLINK